MDIHAHANHPEELQSHMLQRSQPFLSGCSGYSGLTETGQDPHPSGLRRVCSSAGRRPRRFSAASESCDLRIGRSRRRIDGRLRATKDRGRQLLSWRTYVVRYPGWALAAALGAGMTASNVLRPGRIARWLGNSLVRQAFGGFRQQALSTLRRIWLESSPGEK